MQVRIPLYGCDCYAYGLLAAGFCDLVVEADMKPYDYLALVPIVEGAGGIMTDWKVITCGHHPVLQPHQIVSSHYLSHVKPYVDCVGHPCCHPQ